MYTHVAIIEKWAKEGVLSQPLWKRLPILGKTDAESIAVLTFRSIAPIGYVDTQLMRDTPGIMEFHANYKEEQHCPRCPLYGRQPQLILPIEFEAQIAVGEMPICETCAQEERQTVEAK